MTDLTKQQNETTNRLRSVLAELDMEMRQKFPDVLGQARVALPYGGYWVSFDTDDGLQLQTPARHDNGAQDTKSYVRKLACQANPRFLWMVARAAGELVALLSAEDRNRRNTTAVVEVLELISKLREDGPT